LVKTLEEDMKLVPAALVLVTLLCLAGTVFGQEQPDTTPQQFISAEEMLIRGDTAGIGIELVTVHGRTQFDTKRLVKRSFLPEIQKEAQRAPSDAQ